MLMPLFPINLLSSFRDNTMFILYRTCVISHRCLTCRLHSYCSIWGPILCFKNCKSSFNDSIIHTLIQTMRWLFFTIEFLAVFLAHNLIILHSSTLSLHVSPGSVNKRVQTFKPICLPSHYFFSNSIFRVIS